MRRAIVVLALVSVIGIAGAALGRSAMETGAQEDTATAAGHPLVGTWIIDDVNNPTDAPSLTVFTADGIVLDASAAGRTGAGSWRVTGPRSGAATFVYVIEGPAGNYRANVIIRAALDVAAGGNTLTARYSYTAVAPDGTVVRSLRSTARGVRVSVEPVEAEGSPLAGFPTVEAAPQGTPAT
ncbi:MAG TPA: hypothetical protein VH482_23920 [Thermomicrobiales bacterium]|jgi:hypothetical protein